MMMFGFLFLCVLYNELPWVTFYLWMESTGYQEFYKVTNSLWFSRPLKEAIVACESRKYKQIIDISSKNVTNVFWSRDSKTSARSQNCVSHAQKIILINQRGRHLGSGSNWMLIYVHTRPFTNNRERRQQFWPKFWIETITLMLLRTSEGRAILRLSESNCAIVTTDLPRWSLIFSKKGVQVSQWDPK